MQRIKVPQRERCAPSVRHSGQNALSCLSRKGYNLHRESVAPPPSAALGPKHRENAPPPGRSPNDKHAKCVNSTEGTFRPPRSAYGPKQRNYETASFLLFFRITRGRANKKTIIRASGPGKSSGKSRANPYFVGSRLILAPEPRAAGPGPCRQGPTHLCLGAMDGGPGPLSPGSGPGGAGSSLFGGHGRRGPAFEGLPAHKLPDFGPTRKSATPGEIVGEIRKSGFRDLVRTSYGGGESIGFRRLVF